MRKSIFVAAIVAFAPVAAQAGQVTPPDGLQRVEPTGSERICRSQGVVGSRLGARRVCRTQAEWNEQDRMARTMVRDNQNRHMSPTVDWQAGKPNGSAPFDPR